MKSQKFRFSIRVLLAVTFVLAIVVYANSPATLTLPCTQKLHNTPMWVDPIDVVLSSGDGGNWSAQWLATDFGDTITVRMPRWKSWLVDSAEDFEITELHFD